MDMRFFFGIGMGGIIIILLGYFILYRIKITRKYVLPIEHIEHLTPKDIVAIFPQTTESITAQTEIGLQNAQSALEKLMALPKEKRSFANTAQALDSIVALSDSALLANIASVLEQVSPDEKIRQAAHEAVIKIQNFFIDYVTNNKELYEAFKAYATGNALQEKLNSEQNYFIQETLKDFTRAGLNLPDLEREEIRALRKKIALLVLEFERNISADRSTIQVTKKELAGLDEDFINALQKTSDGLCILGIDYPTYYNVMENCTVEKTREALSHTFFNRAYHANEEILKEIIELRDTLAKILGYSSYDHLDIDNQMAKNPETVNEFLIDLMEKSQKKEKQEIAAWITDLPDSVTLADGKVKPWDLLFLKNSYKKKHFTIDEREIAAYFPMESTVKGLLDIYQQFLGVEFKEVPISGLWYDDIKYVQVYTKHGQLIGHLLLDLFPRPFKYSHACQATIIPAVKSNGEDISGLSLVIANFPKPTGGKPALLMRKDVQTFFHEFGHALHALLGKTAMASLSGTSVKRDFVEMPSQMLEEWLWNKEILKKVSNHYQTGQPLPDDMIDNIIKLKNYDSGNFVQTQGFYSFISLDYFKEGEKKNPYEILKELYHKYRERIVWEPRNHFYASFGHLTGYGAKYYSYLWSKVFALDLFNEIKKQGLLNPEVGERYVREILHKGGSQDPNELLKNFLGREPNNRAFLESLGL